MYTLLARNLWIASYTMRKGVLWSVAYTNCEAQAIRYHTKIEAWAVHKLLKRFGSISTQIVKIHEIAVGSRGAVTTK